MNQDTKKINLAIICGGPSLERGISLNSARSVLDHLGSKQIVIHPIYVDFFGNYYAISTAQLYSNTPSDFDFKLAKMAQKLTQDEVIAKLKSVDLVFPVIHGTYGEDGTLQKFLEANNIPFIGCGSDACMQMFYKDRAAQVLREHNFATIPSVALKIDDPQNEKIITDFFKRHNLERAIIKPVAGGSSIGVFSVYSIEEAMERLQRIAALGLFKNIIIEPFCRGKEFTVIVLEKTAGEPVALVPTDIQVSYENGQIFDYRRKYLPTANTSWHCPPQFDDSIVAIIRAQAAQIFKLFGMRDFARLDGWILDDGKIIFSDLNPISGMEQNSFIFQQASRIGISHQQLLWYVLTRACARCNIGVPKMPLQIKGKKPVYVLFGGKTSERQVSLMSGTNVWLKLRQSADYEPIPYFLDKKRDVWYLPYTYALNHTVEEVYENCLTASSTAERLENLAAQVRAELGLQDLLYRVQDNLPLNMSLEKFFDKTKRAGAFLFLALHGGEGEDGTIQQMLDERGILYNGSGANASLLCMDKFLTGQAVMQAGETFVATIAKKAIVMGEFANYNTADYQRFWTNLEKELQSDSFIIKPRCSGCSAGVIRLMNAADLEKYVFLVRNKAHVIPADTFIRQHSIVEMELDNVNDFIIETYLEADSVVIQNNELIYHKHTGWVELTVGVLESAGKYHALNPSITVAEGAVLSLEEKFQGGTGINITPPPISIVTTTVCQKIKRGIEKVAKALGIENYARIDVFFNVDSEKLFIIEANTLPALTPSTVLYHQALAEEPPMYPLAFLEMLLQLKAY